MNILRSGSIIHTVTIDKETVYSSQIMADKKITATWVSATPMDVRIGDYTVWKGENYTINLFPGDAKINNRSYRYNVVFEHPLYELYSKRYVDEGDMDFPYSGTLIEFMELLMESINSIIPGWTYSYEGPDTPIKTLGFKEESCRNALNRICTEYGVEFRCTGRHLTVKKNVGFLTTQTFEVGRGRGLYTLSRRNVDEKGVVTRLYVFGGNKNLTFDYRDGAKRLMYAPKGENFIDSNTELYGIREGSVIFEDIYPRRTGQVTSSADPLSFVDLGLNFDINAQLLEGQEAKVVFNSGHLMGNEFVIQKYDHEAKKITLKPNIEENDYTLPNELNFPEAGNEYTLVNIKLPESYITDAEAELQTAATEYAAAQKIGFAKVVYDLAIDPKYILDTGIEMAEGNTVLVKDGPLGIDDRIRVHGVSYPLVEESEIAAVLSDTIPENFKDRVRKDTVKSKIEVREVNRARIEDSREATMRLRQLQGMVYDADGYFDTGNIKPGSIETIMLAVGQASQNMELHELIVTPAFGGDPNAFQLSSAVLAHLEYEIEGLGYEWEIDLRMFEGLDEAVPYYVYAKCSKTALVGTWELSPVPILTEEVVGFYHLWIGVLYQVNNGLRAFEFTKGMTFIIGGQIVTEVTRSADGKMFTDYMQGKFKYGTAGNSIDWNVTQEGTLYIDGVLIAKMAFIDDAEIINLIVKNLRTNATGKRVQITEADNSLKFYNLAGELVLQIDDALGTDLDGNVIAGTRVNNPANGRTAWMGGGGVFSNGSGVPFFAASSGLQTNATLVGLLQQRNTDPNGISAGVTGIDQTSTGDSRSFGGFFNSALIGGLSLVSPGSGPDADYTIGRLETYIPCYNAGSITVSLPASVTKDRIIFIRRVNAGAVTINGNGKMIVFTASPTGSVDIPNRYETAMLYYDEAYWHMNIL